MNYMKKYTKKKNIPYLIAHVSPGSEQFYKKMNFIQMTKKNVDIYDKLQILYNELNDIKISSIEYKISQLQKLLTFIEYEYQDKNKKMITPDSKYLIYDQFNQYYDQLVKKLKPNSNFKFSKFGFYVYHLWTLIRDFTESVWLYTGEESNKYENKGEIKNEKQEEYDEEDYFEDEKEDLSKEEQLLTLINTSYEKLKEHAKLLNIKYANKLDILAKLFSQLKSY